MSLSQIEAFDNKRTKYNMGLAWGSVIFFIAWILRFLARIYYFEEIIQNSLLLILIISVAVQAIFAVLLNILARKISSDPELRKALYNEMIQLNMLKAWKAAFFAIIIFVVIVGVVALIITIEDIMFILITIPLLGFSVYNISLYLYSRS